MIARGVRAFLDRDWAAVGEAKAAYWADFVHRHGPLEALRIADELRRQVQERQPGWPSAEERAADLEAHVQLAERLRRGGNSRRR